MLVTAGVLLSNTPADGCRVAPYVNMPSMKFALDRLHLQHMSHFEPSLTVHPPPHPMLFHPYPHYAMNLALASASLASSKAALLDNFTLAASGLTTNKNSSIEDLRLKAKKHAATLGL